MLGIPAALLCSIMRYRCLVILAFALFAQAVSAGDVANLQLQQSLSSTGSFRPGAEVLQSAQVINLGPDAATAVVVEIRVPVGLEFVRSEVTSSTIVCAGLDPGLSGTLRCTLPALAPGESIRATAVSQIREDLAPGTVLEFVSSVASSTSDPQPQNNSASQSLLFQNGSERADLRVEAVNPAQTVVSGTYQTYLLRAVNDGPDSAASTTFVLYLPLAAQQATMTPPPGWTCVRFPAIGVIGGVLGEFGCQRFRFDPGSLDFRLDVLIPTQTVGDFVFSYFIVSATTDPNPQNNQGGVRSRVGGQQTVGVPTMGLPALIALLMALLLMGMFEAKRIRQ